MTKKLLFAAIAIMLYISGYSQANLWIKVSDEKVAGLEKSMRESMPSRYQLFSLDLQALKNILQSAPNREDFTQSQIIVAFPNPEGVLENYRVYEAPVMADELSARYPDIKSYVGKGIDNPVSTIRFSISLFGLHTVTFNGEGASYIDTYTKDLSNYIVYRKSDISSNRSFECTVVNDAQNFGPKNLEVAPFSTQANDGKLRKYDLAMACTGEYAEFHIDQANLPSNATNAQKKAVVLSAMNDCMTRVNEIYERDLSITMILIANNDALIFLNPDTDGLNNYNGGTLLGQIQQVINNTVGSTSYDIGHVVSTGGGGIAQLGAVCSNNGKGRGVTGSPYPLTDSFYIDYVAHEMGHQFGANHTFNANANNSGSCAGNRNADTAVEPGSGTTIMAYAGICENADVQTNSDPYFHAVSLKEMMDYITSSANCATIVNIANNEPVIAAIPNRTIPKSTAFILKGNATDSDGDGLTYCWEQTDANGVAFTASPSSSTLSGPNFRSLNPSASPDRYMPPFQNVLQGNLTPDWQVIPSIGRTMKFALTVRDNASPNGGQTARRDVTISVSGSAGPFKISYPNTTGIIWAQGSTQNITWDVNNTQPLSANVNIKLTTDGGATFTTLAANTPNDGSENIVVPTTAAATANCRILIEAAENIFYTISSKPFAIQTLGTEDFGLDNFVLYPNPNKGNFTVKFSSASSNEIDITVHDMRGRQIFSKAYENSGLFSGNVMLDGAQAGIYLVTVQDGNRKEVKRIVID